MSGRFDPVPVTLEGRDVALDPLAARHAGDLLEAARDPAIWAYMSCEPLDSPDRVTAWIDTALAEQAAGSRLPFAVVETAGGRAVGSTSYLEIRRAHRGLEIGWTWLAAAVQRTGVNTQCKLALLAHAFDDLGAVRVQFKTDSLNVRSQRAIERIGGVREGVLRRHMVMPGGRLRDSVYYAITDDRWPEVRARLERLAGLTPRG